jgi:hypothetical protein
MADSDEELSVRDLFRQWERAAGPRLHSSGSKGAGKADGNQQKSHVRRRKHGRGEDSSPAAAAAGATATAGAAAGAQGRPLEETLGEGSDQVSVFGAASCDTAPMLSAC